MLSLGQSVWSSLTSSSSASLSSLPEVCVRCSSTERGDPKEGADIDSCEESSLERFLKRSCCVSKASFRLSVLRMRLLKAGEAGMLREAIDPAGEPSEANVGCGPIKLVSCSMFSEKFWSRSGNTGLEAGGDGSDDDGSSC